MAPPPDLSTEGGLCEARRPFGPKSGGGVDDPDRQIVEAILQGDTERYSELVHQYQLAAWRLAFSFVGNLEDARELAQNAFVNAFRSLSRFRGRSKFSTWLYRIVSNECKDFLRRKAREPVMVSLEAAPGESDRDAPELFEGADTRGDPRQSASNRELAEKLARAIGRLPMKQRLAFLLHTVHGMPLEEVSGVMSCRVGTVKAHLFRASESLRLFLEPALAEETRR